MLSWLGSYWFLILACIGSICISLGGLWLVRRNVSHEVLMNHHDVAGAMLSIVGTLFAVVLGLVVVGSLGKFEQARNVVTQEANSLRDIFSLAAGLPPPLDQSLRQSCIDYAKVVSTEEWELMANGSYSKKADEILDQMDSDVVKFHPETNGQSNLQQSLLAEVNQLDDGRAQRTVLSTPAFEPLVWTVLIFGSVVLVVFTYFFGVENFKIQMLMTTLVAIVLVLNLIIISMFAYPFSGDVRVWPVAFEADLQIFQKALKEQKQPH